MALKQHWLIGTIVKEIEVLGYVHILAMEQMIHH
jgi:hypothetical protein